jgi:hypothetical protein
MPAIDLRKGAGNFLKGATPSQDMIAVFVGISRCRMGVDIADRVARGEVFKTSLFRWANPAELSLAV